MNSDMEASMAQGDNRTRAPEDRIIDEHTEHDVREKMLDKTIADTFPASDPPSSIPDPDDDSFEPEPYAVLGASSR
jgi:hypothetical protein